MATKAKEPTAAAAAAATVVTVVALVTVEHDQVRYGPGEDAGEEFDLSKAQAAALLAVNAVKLKGAVEA